MRKHASTAWFTLLTCLGLWLIVIKPAHAYVDPGNGSYFLQLSIAMLLGGAYAAKGFWGNIRQAMRHALHRREAPPSHRL